MVIAVMPRKRRRSYWVSSNMLSLLFYKLLCAYPIGSVVIQQSHHQHGGETIRRWSRRDVQRCGLFPHRPLPHKGPMIAPQPLGGRIDATLVQRRTARRRKIFGAFKAD